MATLSEIRDCLQQRLLTHLYRGTESLSLVLKGGWEEDRLLSGITYRRATPEAALLHWLYLSMRANAANACNFLSRWYNSRRSLQDFWLPRQGDRMSAR